MLGPTYGSVKMVQGLFAKSTDQTQDQLVGMVLSLDKNGCDEQEIQKYMAHDRSTIIYVIMAIPLKQAISPFILQMFGSDNKFKTIDVIHRWNHTVEQLKRY